MVPLRLAPTAAIAAMTCFALLGCAPASMRSDGCPLGFSRVPAGTCEPNETCRSAPECRTKGACTYYQGQCVATSEADCRRSENCARLGECAFDPRFDRAHGVGLCIADEEGCRASQICRELGKCSPSRKDVCTVGSDADCRQSQVCAAQGRCTAAAVTNAHGRRSGMYTCAR